MEVTGGGIVREGDDVTIKLCIEEGETCDKSKWTLTTAEGNVTKCQVEGGEIR